jgi:hypothetical protein
VYAPVGAARIVVDQHPHDLAEDHALRLLHRSGDQYSSPGHRSPYRLDLRETLGLAAAPSPGGLHVGYNHRSQGLADPIEPAFLPRADINIDLLGARIAHAGQHCPHGSRWLLRLLASPQYSCWTLLPPNHAMRVYV